MEKKVLVIDESSLFRKFIKQKLESMGFEVALALNGLDGSAKIRSFSPDLLVVDYFVTRKPILELLQDKQKDPNTRNIPVILIADEVTRDKVVQTAPFKVRKIYSRPIKIDALLSGICDVFGVPLELDQTPCILETHLNDDILFIELAMGLNAEKIGLLHYKIQELNNLYHIKTPKVLILMSDIKISPDDRPKLELLFSQILDYTEGKTHYIKILSKSIEMKAFINLQTSFRGIKIVESLEEAMDGLLGKSGLEKSTAEQDNVHARFLQSKRPEMDQDKSINLKLESDALMQSKESYLQREFSIALVDDDFVVHEIVKNTFSQTKWTVTCFNNGQEFVDSGKIGDFEFILLDLMMPKMNGFQVLEYLDQHQIPTPVSILSALSRRETVKKALAYKIKTYMIKPINAQEIFKKTLEVIYRKF